MPQSAREFIEQQTSRHTADAYRHDLLTWFAFLGERVETREIAIEYRQFLEGRYSPRTAARRFNTARAFYRWVGEGNVFEGVKSPKRLRNATPVIPDDRTVDALFGADCSPRDAAVLALLLNGLRASEVIGLRPDDFVWAPQHGCHIIRVMGKGNKERLVPANSETSQRVSAYLSISKRGVPWLIGALRGNESMTRRQITEVMRRACKRAGVPEVSPHKLRHHFGTRMWQAKKDLLALQNLMGHESPVTTQVYVRLDLSDVVDMMKHDPRNNRKEADVEDYTDDRAGGRNPLEGAGDAERGVPALH